MSGFFLNPGALFLLQIEKAILETLDTLKQLTKRFQNFDEIEKYMREPVWIL